MNFNISWEEEGGGIFLKWDIGYYARSMRQVREGNTILSQYQWMWSHMKYHKESSLHIQNRSFGCCGLAADTPAELSSPLPRLCSHFSITLCWLSKIVLVIFKVTFWPLQLWLCGGGEMLDVATHHWHVCWFPSIAFGNFKHFGQNVRANNRRLKESMHIWKHGNFQVLLLPGDLGCSIRAAHFLPPVIPF